MTDTAKGAYLTPEAFERLKGELEHLSTEGRTELSKRIEAARDEGDLRENGGYHAAKEEQGKLEARIRQITQLLESATVGGTPPPDDGIVEPGMVVTVEMLGEQETFLLGHREIQGHTDLQVFSEASPLGDAVNGKSAGDTVSYVAPNGTTVEVKILQAQPYAG